ncbi:MAG: helix-hairpin-helix domain-containing protein [Cyanobium sp.]|nr:helix-hairpin-helix domain-containing protein [Cyanobium sp.]
MSLCRDRATGQIVTFIGHHDRDWAMLNDSAGRTYYAPLTQLEFYEPGKGATGEQPQPQSAEQPVDENALPPVVIPPETRLNVNTATPEQLAHAVRGIGYATAKKIVELRQSLPGERFKALEQLRQIGRVDWDEVFKEDQIVIA